MCPPLFVRSQGFEFDLTCLAQDEEPLLVDVRGAPSAEEISERTGLDLTQSESLLNTLRREISLIQGPPGTGKSYTGEKLIQAMLSNKKRAKLGPIVCVCYTNHALDQLLEHLLDAGIKGIIRIGSRSKSARLQQFNLRVVAEEMDLTKVERSKMFNLGRRLTGLQDELFRLLRALSECDSLASLRDYLQSNHEQYYDQLFSVAEDIEGFQEVRNTNRNAVEQWLAGGDRSPHGGPNLVPRHRDMLSQMQLEDLTHEERVILHREWLEDIRDDLIQSFLEDYRDYEQALKQRNMIRQEVQHRCLQQADIIGLKTTGMARDLHLLRKLRSKVVVCEEAGEVLEAHILTALLPSVEQLILIGDHLQLRPQTQDYRLQSTNPWGVQYSLDVSLFERLVQPPNLSDARLPVSVLETQRRMHPSIAEIVRSMLYLSLKDSENVKHYSEVVGMQRRLFWLDLQHLEKGAAEDDPHNTSHSNDFEVEMSTAIVSHLVRQGAYSPDDIAVLTPYLGQLQKLRRRMAAESTFAVNLDDRDIEDLDALDGEDTEKSPEEKHPVARTTLLKSIRLATVDNFQGEEAKIVIISLVRSNPRNRCGFLSTSNRINVLMSRAKHGCYILGNSETYRRVPEWDQTIQLLQQHGNFGAALELQCPRHQDTSIRVKDPDQFAILSPDGGCNIPCDRLLDCGHACYSPCHSYFLHKAVRCREKCPRLKQGCGHNCPRECGEPCEEMCSTTLKGFGLELPCGHIMESPKCWQAQNPGKVRCSEQVDRVIPGCGHVVKLSCHIEVNLPGFRCDARCGAILPCGHTCLGLCSLCNIRENGDIVETAHKTCKQVCERENTICPHICKEPCHGKAECAPCEAQCKARCSHSRCSKPCREPCKLCVEGQCASQCPHARCSLPCAAPCDWVPCSRRCSLILSCGHQCPSICGEPCPASVYCQKCGSQDILSAVVDSLTMVEYRDVDLDQTPCIFPDCGHFLTAASMDLQMSMSAHYDMNDKNIPVGIKSISNPFSVDEVKVCPQCRGPLRSVARYGRIVRRAMLDETTKNFIMWSNHKYLELFQRLLQEQKALEKRKDAFNDGFGSPGSLRLAGNSADQIIALQRWIGNDRYNGFQKLLFDVNRYLAQVKIERQPFQKFADLVHYVNRPEGSTPSFSFDNIVIQLRGHVLSGTCACDDFVVEVSHYVLGDFLRLWKQYSTSRTEIVANFKDILAQCQVLIELSRATDRPQFQAEGHIYCAQLCGCSMLLEPPSPQDSGMQLAQMVPGSFPVDETVGTSEDPREQYKSNAAMHIATAQYLMLGHAWPSMFSMEADIKAVENMLEGGVFYRSITADEMSAVYTAMEEEFQATSHWHECEKGHPFAAGECDLPVEEIRCPECGSSVSGLG